jgi:hypothetical protein
VGAKRPIAGFALVLGIRGYAIVVVYIRSLAIRALPALPALPRRRVQVEPLPPAEPGLEALVIAQIAEAEVVEQPTRRG